MELVIFKQSMCARARTHTHIKKNVKLFFFREKKKVKLDPQKV